MKMPTLVVGYTLDNEMFAKSFPLPDALAWIKWLANDELTQFFGELLELMIAISEEKEDSETVQEFLEYWHEIALNWREMILEDAEPGIFEEGSKTLPNVVTDWNINDLEAALAGKDPATLFNTLAGLIGKSMINSERDASADIAETEQELDSPWVDIIESQPHQRSTPYTAHDEPEVVDVTEQERDHYLAQPISELELSARAHNCLEWANIKTVRDLATKTESELLAYKGLGRGSLLEIKEQLANRGLTLGMHLG